MTPTSVDAVPSGGSGLHETEMKVDAKQLSYVGTLAQWKSSSVTISHC
jgi:hypothetical protein